MSNMLIFLTHTLNHNAHLGHYKIIFIKILTLEKSAGNIRECAEHTSGHVTYCHVTDVISGHVTSSNIFIHFRSKGSKVTRLTDGGPVEGSVLLHQ